MVHRRVSNSLIVLSAVVLLAAANNNLCPISKLQGKCQCIKYEDELLKNGVRIECSKTTSSKFHHDIDIIDEYLTSKLNKSRSIYALQVRDSRLNQLRGLPGGLREVRHLTFDNTGIDPEQIRESSELLSKLISLRVYNENFTEIPENFFQEMPQTLAVIELNQIGITAISEEAFRHLEDSLKELRLRKNKLRQIPIAIEALHNLETLDLEDNEISSVKNDLTHLLESNLKSLYNMFMNRINCSCEFGKTDFVTWIRTHAIKGVTCHVPGHLAGRDISTTPTDDFCYTSSFEQQRFPRVTLMIVGLGLALLLNKFNQNTI